MLATIVGNACKEDMVVAALDDVDRVDLHIAEMLDCRGGRGRSAAKGCRTVELLSAKPDSPGLGLGDRNRVHFGRSPGTGLGWISYFARDGVLRLPRPAVPAPPAS